MISRQLIVLAGVASLAACGKGDGDAPTTAQDREMDAAARMLDEAPNGLTGIDDRELLTPQNEAPPANRAPDGG